MLQPRPWFLAAFVLYTVGIKLVPYVLYQFGMSIDPETTTYPWNFSPLYALCLFGAAHFAQTRWSYAVPLVAALLTDLGIGLLTGQLAFAVYPYQPFVYGATVLMITMGLYLRKDRSISALVGVGAGSSLVFFLVSNFGVWLLSGNPRFTPDLAGLMTCYVDALPFLRNGLISMAVFGAVLFSPVALKSGQRDVRPALAAE